MMMGTDMHVAIEAKRDSYSYTHGRVEPQWMFIKEWTVDRWYDLFGCFNNVRRFWSNALSFSTATNLSSHLKYKENEYCYGFYIITPDILKNNVLGWSPAKKDWAEWDKECERPVIDKEWFFDINYYVGDDTYKKDPVNYAIYKMMIKRYGKENVRLIVYFDS